VRVPEGAGFGKAKVHLSYPDWQEGKVTTAILEVPIVEAKPNPDHKNRFAGGLKNARRAVAAIEELAGQVEIKEGEVIGVRLQGPKVTAAALQHLRHLMDLQSLELKQCAVTDDGLAHLRGLASLKQLCLTGTPVGDAGLAHLTGLTKLESLDVNGTKVTKEGVKQLKRALPSLKAVQ
jgi:Leucine Rich repeat